MQAPTRDPIRENRIRPPLSLELPEEFRSGLDAYFNRLEKK